MTPTHIAIVDDEPDITQLLAGYLSRQGFRVSALGGGHALIELMSADRPDLVLLDLGLPGEDGFAIARQLRERWRCGLIIVTGRGDAVDKVVGLEIGAAHHGGAAPSGAGGRGHGSATSAARAAVL